VGYLFLIIGIVALLIGGESLVRGSVGIALRLKISSLVIGMTVVSFGTSAPELLVSLSSVLNGMDDVAIGAVIGSNISNLGLVLGITVLIFPIVVSKDTIKIDWPLMMVASLLFYFLSFDRLISSYEGVLFVCILLSFSIWLVLKSRKQGKKLYEEGINQFVAKNAFYKDVIFLIVGIVGLYFGAEWLIKGVVIVGNEFSISQKFISVTVVAFGTSIPELVTSAVAAYRKETDISIGNLIGSNVFNILAILGVTAIFKPIVISDSIMEFDVYFLLGISLLVFPLMYFGRKINRIKGVVLLLFYSIYIYFTIMNEF
jgi:cation:H+ antiporter